MQRSYTKIDNEHMKQIIEAQPRKTSWGDAYYLLVNMCTFPKRTKKIKNQLITLQQNEAAVAQSVMRSDWSWTTQEVRSFLSYLDKNDIFSMRKVKSKGGKVICTIFKPKGLYNTLNNTPNNTPKTSNSKGLRHIDNITGKGLSNTTDNTPKTSNSKGLRHIDNITGKGLSNTTDNTTTITNYNKLKYNNKAKAPFEKLSLKEQSEKAVLFIRRRLSENLTVAMSEKLERLKSLPLLMDDFESHFIEKQLNFDGSQNAENGIWVYFEKYIQKAFEKAIDAAKAKNVTDYTSNPNVLKMKETWAANHADWLLDKADDKHLGAILGVINKIVQTDKKIQGLTNFKATTGEKMAIWTTYCENVPMWIQEKRYSFRYIAQNFNTIYREAKTEAAKPKSSKVPVADRVKEMGDFYRGNNNAWISVKRNAPFCGPTLKHIMEDWAKKQATWEDEPAIKKHQAFRKMLWEMRNDKYRNSPYAKANILTDDDWRRLDLNPNDLEAYLNRSRVAQAA